MPIPIDTYCNPLSIPNYPAGVESLSRNPRTPADGFSGNVCDYRELADPELIYDTGKWYMFCSGSSAFVSNDLVNWEYRPIDTGGNIESQYAPTIAKANGQFIITASRKNMLYSAPTPLGPYKALGPVLESNGEELTPEYLDPSLFTDDDGRLFLYWGCSPWGGGIFGVELDAENPTRTIGEKQKLLEFEPSHAFERFGEYGEVGNMSWMEGAAMFKHNGIYYLQYATNGTVFKHYAIGVARGLSPLGPFQMQHTPVCLSPDGMVTGTGHGGWVKGKGDDVWQFYTCICRRLHRFERRIGMDRVIFQANGEVHVEVSSTPQSVSQGSLGLVPVSVRKQIQASSFDGSNFPTFAIDECTHTWWAPKPEDASPWIEIDLRYPFTVEAIQICWADINLDFGAGIIPEPTKYKVEFFDKEHNPTGAPLDCMNNTDELLIDFRTFQPVPNTRILRVSFTQPNNALRHGITEITAFAKPISSLAEITDTAENAKKLTKPK